MNDHHVLPSLAGGGPPIVGAVGRSAFSPSSKGGGMGKAKLSDLKLGSTGAVEMSTFQVPAEVCVLVVCVHAGMRVCGCVCVHVCLVYSNLSLGEFGRPLTLKEVLRLLPRTFPSPPPCERSVCCTQAGHEKANSSGGTFICNCLPQHFIIAMTTC